VDDPGRLLTRAVDVADAAAVVAAVASVREVLGPVTGLVNVAGIGGSGSFVGTHPVTWDRVLRVHLGGTVACTRAVLPDMLAAGDGRIVNILTDGLWHGRTTVSYTTAKGAILGFTRSLALEVAAEGVRVNAVAPGPVATRMLLDDDPAVIAAELATVPIGRAIEATEVAATIAFLLGPGGAPYVGQVLAPNGGTVFSG
jgi:2-hydroxycyclohexanecarboxyl-CoA dehydrogenase